MQKNTQKIAIANRGEVAVRIHRACKALGYQTVLLHSEPDVQSTAYRLCDETYCIGPGPSAQSYINIDNVIDGALATGAKALHPGFGFLSENADFAKKCADKGIVFIGPSPESMELFGDKIKAKDFCESVDVPTLKSYRGKKQDLDTLLDEGKKLGYPLLIKASAGGGGRGMRVVHDPKDFKVQLQSAKEEALKAFGSDTVFLEQYLERSKHIEVQIFGNSEGEVFVLGERECSVQRRHQKIIEEALSPSLDKDLRKKVYDYALKLATSAKYKNAGTVEFLFDKDRFYFLEVNTRLQVEHPVTEEIFGVDLVKAQIQTAFLEKISFENLKPKNHSIECRIYAEDLKGLPSIGTLGSVSMKASGVRVEQGFEKGDTISPFYDSMIAKTIYTGETREKCIEKAITHLKSIRLTGVMTNIPLLIKILEHKDFTSSLMDTGFFNDHFSSGIDSPLKNEDVEILTESLLFKTTEDTLFEQQWRFSKNEDTSISDSLETLNTKRATNSKTSENSLFVEEHGGAVWMNLKGYSYTRPSRGVHRLKKKSKLLSQSDGDIVSPMPGQILRLNVKLGDSVEEGQVLCVVEAMKMEHTLKSPFAGTIEKVDCKVGESLSLGDLVIKIKAKKS